jgi:carbon-monoxide dehydrogenase small subunit
MTERSTRVIPISLEVNGKRCEAQLAPSTLLVDFLREDLSLNGTHQGCDTAQCGACTVLVAAIARLAW